MQLFAFTTSPKLIFFIENLFSLNSNPVALILLKSIYPLTSKVYNCTTGGGPLNQLKAVDVLFNWKGWKKATWLYKKTATH